MPTSRRPTVNEVQQTLPHHNDRSHLYAYDGLQRLVRADTGSLSSTNDAILTGAGAPPPFVNEWALDALGNWTGDLTASPPAPGLRQTLDFDGDGTLETRGVWHVADRANRVRFVTETPPAPPQGGGWDPFDPAHYQSGATTAAAFTTLVHDPAGNLLTDGSYYYQYDAWNRLAQVNLVGTLLFDRDTGRITEGQPGGLKRRYAYDGLGRLIRTDLPHVSRTRG